MSNIIRIFVLSKTKQIMDRRTMIKRIIEKTSSSKNNLMVFALWTDEEVIYAYNKLYYSKQKDPYKAEDLWCQCDGIKDPKYWDDGEHPDLYKHHWRCGDCEKIVQIG